MYDSDPIILNIYKILMVMKLDVKPRLGWSFKDLALNHEATVVG